MSDLEYMGSITEFDGRKVVCLPVEKYRELLAQRDYALITLRVLVFHHGIVPSAEVGGAHMPVTSMPTAKPPAQPVDDAAREGRAGE